MRRVLVIQNVDCEPLGRFAGAPADFRYLRPYDGEAVPATLQDWDALIVLGGPMAVYEAAAFPFLEEELRLLRQAIGLDFPTLGICLGSQLIAAAAGARVYGGGVRETGWVAVELTGAAASDAVFAGLESPLSVFQLHGDTFDLPEGAVRLARNSTYDNQAFRLGRNVYGLQFHLEVNLELAGSWTRIYHDYITGGGGDPGSIVAETAASERALADSCEKIITRFLELGFSR